MTCHTSGPAPAARTWISTSSSPITGLGTSRNSNTSASPYLSCTIAFMASPSGRSPFSQWCEALAKSPVEAGPLARCARLDHDSDGLLRSQGGPAIFAKLPLGEREPLEDQQQWHDELEHGSGRNEDEAQPGIELDVTYQRHGYPDRQGDVCDQAQHREEARNQPGHVQQVREDQSS